MKETPSPHNLHSSQRRLMSTSYYASPHSVKNKDKTASIFNHIAAAAKKVAVVLTVIFYGKRKSGTRLAATEGRRNSNQVKGVSFSTDLSSGSNTTKSSWKSKSSSSYSSFSTVGSGQLGLGNFTLDEVYKATGKFSQDNIIGEGGFGIVYKGKLRDGTVVAVKRAKKSTNQKRLSEFKNEIITLSKIEHLNLVRLYGYLEEGDEQIIVVEHVGNGTLRDHIDGIGGNELELSERLDIAIDVAHAITYLHMYTDPPIIHRDIKASNILITDKLRAKVADFGFARLVAEDPDVTHISTQVKGTAGYLDPDYLRTYQLTDKSDVYSFGVVLVEMVTGRHPLEPKRSIKERVTIKWAMKLLKEGDVVLTMDPKLRRSPASICAVEKVLYLALECLSPTRLSRPSMKRCAEVLWSIRKEFREGAALS